MARDVTRMPRLDQQTVSVHIAVDAATTLARMGEPAASCSVEVTADGVEIDLLLSDAAVSELASTGRFDFRLGDEHIWFEQPATDSVGKITRVVLRRRLST